MGTVLALDSTAGYQMFESPPNVRVVGSAEDYVVAVFDSKEKLEKSARFFKEGFTNKEKFKQSIAHLLDKKKITKEEHLRLLNLINSCDCGPTLIRQKISTAGLGRILGDPSLDFEDPHHNFTKPIEFLWRWIEPRISKEDRVPATAKKEPDTSIKSVAKRVTALKTKIFKGPEGDKKREHAGEARPTAEEREEENRAIAEVREEETGTKEKPKKGRKKKS